MGRPETYPGIGDYVVILYTGAMCPIYLFQNEVPCIAKDITLDEIRLERLGTPEGTHYDQRHVQTCRRRSHLRIRESPDVVYYGNPGLHGGLCDGRFVRIYGHWHIQRRDHLGQDGH